MADGEFSIFTNPVCANHRNEHWTGLLRAIAEVKPTVTAIFDGLRGCFHTAGVAGTRVMHHRGRSNHPETHPPCDVPLRHTMGFVPQHLVSLSWRQRHIAAMWPWIHGLGAS